jgi:hypothetical protein
MAKLIKNKSVSFNILDPFQLRLKEHAEQNSNFSFYVKCLIERDMERIERKKTPAQPVTNRISLTSMNGMKL